MSLTRSIISPERWSEFNPSRTSVQKYALWLAILQAMFPRTKQTEVWNKAKIILAPRDSWSILAFNFTFIVTVDNCCHQTGNCANISCTNVILFYIPIKLILISLINFNALRCNQFKYCILIGACVPLTNICLAFMLMVCYPLYWILQWHDLFESH